MQYYMYQKKKCVFSKASPNKNQIFYFYNQHNSFCNNFYINYKGQVKILIIENKHQKHSRVRPKANKHNQLHQKHNFNRVRVAVNSATMFLNNKNRYNN